MKIAFITSAFTILNLLLIGILFGGLFFLLLKFLTGGIKYFNSNAGKEEKQLIRKSLSENLKENRIKNNMTQEFVAEALGVSRQAVSKWENGNAEPSTSNLIALSKLYNIPPQDLLPK